MIFHEKRKFKNLIRHDKCYGHLKTVSGKILIFMFFKIILNMLSTYTFIHGFAKTTPETCDI